MTIEEEFKDKDKVIETIIFKHMVLEVILAFCCFWLGFSIHYLLTVL